jgi:nicotinate-nucleotide adenylyltransferase
MSGESANKCIVILGGSFDPVHVAHVALANVFVDLLKPMQLRIIPTGWSAQKASCRASQEQRIAMLTLAFAKLAETTSVFIDTQEIKRAEQGIQSYSVDTLTQLRNEFGHAASFVFLIGADQLQQLHHWKDWRQLFELAHIVVATRPGIQLDTIDTSVANEFKQRNSSIEQLKNQPCGYTYLCTDLSINISSTEIRDGNNLTLVPPDVLNYIQQHHIY